MQNSWNENKKLSERSGSMSISKKLPQRKKTEETLRINMHNLRQYNYLKRTNPGLIKNYGRIHTK